MARLIALCLQTFRKWAGPPESPLIHTTGDGRKYIRSSELIRDPKVRKQIAQAKALHWREGRRAG
jgi:hypothetical protein